MFSGLPSSSWIKINYYIQKTNPIFNHWCFLCFSLKRSSQLTYFAQSYYNRPAIIFYTMRCWQYKKLGYYCATAIKSNSIASTRQVTEGGLNKNEMCNDLITELVLTSKFKIPSTVIHHILQALHPKSDVPLVPLFLKQTT